MFCLSAFPAPLWFLARVLASFVVVLVLEFFAKRRQQTVSATEASEVGGGSCTFSCFVQFWLSYLFYFSLHLQKRERNG